MSQASSLHTLCMMIDEPLGLNPDSARRMLNHHDLVEASAEELKARGIPGLAHHLSQYGGRSMQLSALRDAIRQLSREVISIDLPQSRKALTMSELVPA